jgi:ABC-type amino acid transport system permease subunit
VRVQFRNTGPVQLILYFGNWTPNRHSIGFAFPGVIIGLGINAGAYGRKLMRSAGAIDKGASEGRHGRSAAFRQWNYVVLHRAVRLLSPAFGG